MHPLTGAAAACLDSFACLHCKARLLAFFSRRKVFVNFKKFVAVISLLGTLVTSAVFAAGPNYPFGARIDPYVYGTKPSHVTPAQMDSSIKANYNAWKAAAVVNVPTLPGTTRALC